MKLLSPTSSQLWSLTLSRRCLKLPAVSKKGLSRARSFACSITSGRSTIRMKPSFKSSRAVKTVATNSSSSTPAKHCAASLYCSTIWPLSGCGSGARVSQTTSKAIYPGSWRIRISRGIRAIASTSSRSTGSARLSRPWVTATTRAGQLSNTATPWVLSSLVWSCLPAYRSPCSR